MKELIESASKLAAEHGIKVVVIDGAKNGGGAQAAGPEHEQALAEITKLRGQLKQSEELRAGLEGSLNNASGLLKERDVLSAKVSELQGLVSEYQRKGATNGNGAVPAALPPESSIANYGIDILGLDAKTVKLIEKSAPVKTVGELYGAFMAGKYKAKKRGTDDKDAHFKLEEILEIAHRLMGRIPPGRAPEGSLPAAANGAAPAVSADPTLPAGHAALPWGKLVESARKKEDKVRETQGTITKLFEQYNKLKASPPTPDVAAAMAKIAGDPLDLTDKTSLGAHIKLKEMYEGQLLAQIGRAHV